MKYAFINGIILDGTENRFNAGGGAPYSLKLLNMYRNNNEANIKCNYYEATYYSTSWGSFNYMVTANGTADTTPVIKFKNIDISSLDDFKTWLSTHNTTVYYVLATPTYTQITGTLAEQLENLYNAMSKNGQTNISQVNNDLGFILGTGVLENIGG